ncbi:hypothetical protein ACHAWF_004638 [Thalassiosira exigua]
MTSPGTVRPYTSYHLFFQLEREYILQKLLGFRPEISAEDTFDPADESNYRGPPLPPRYDDLVLLRDWHVPGKTRRRKRSHRKSHGKIGFNELNERISQAWSRADRDTRAFCVSLADGEAREYKEAKKNAKPGGRQTVGEEKENELVASFDWTFDLPREDAADAHDDDRSQSIFPSQDESFQQVDMKDDEIMSIWRSTAAREGDPSDVSFQTCVEIPVTEEEKRQADAKMSIIESEYEKFKEIGERFSKKRMLPSGLKLKAIVPSQA